MDENVKPRLRNQTPGGDPGIISTGSAFVARSFVNSVRNTGARFVAGAASGDPLIQGLALNAYGRLFGGAGGGSGGHAPPPLDHMDNDLHQLLLEQSKNNVLLDRVHLEIKSMHMTLKQLLRQNGGSPSGGSPPPPFIRSSGGPPPQPSPNIGSTGPASSGTLSPDDALTKYRKSKEQSQEFGTRLSFLATMNPNSPSANTTGLFYGNTNKIDDLKGLAPANAPNYRAKGPLEIGFNMIVEQLRRLNEKFETDHQIDEADKVQEDERQDARTDRIIDAIDGKTKAPGAKKSGAFGKVKGLLSEGFGIAENIAEGIGVFAVAKKFLGLLTGGIEAVVARGAIGEVLAVGGELLGAVALPVLATGLLALAGYSIYKYATGSKDQQGPMKDAVGRGAVGRNSSLKDLFPEGVSGKYDLGSFSRQFEASRDYGNINSADTGKSKSYGAYQFNARRDGTGSLFGLIKGQKEFEGLDPFDLNKTRDGKNFDETFRDLSRGSADFRKKQDEYFRSQYADPAIKSFRSITGVDPGPLTSSVLASLNVTGASALNTVVGTISRENLAGMSDKQIAMRLLAIKREKLTRFYKSRYSEKPSEFGKRYRADQQRVDNEMSFINQLDQSSIRFEPDFSKTPQAQAVKSMAENYVLRNNERPAAPAVIPVPVGGGGGGATVNDNSTKIVNPPIDDTIRSLTQGWLGSGSL